MKLRTTESIWTALCAQLLARTDVETAGLLLGEPLETPSGPIVVVREAFAVPEAAYRIRRRDQISLDPVALTLVAGAGVAELLRLTTAFAGTEFPPLRLAFSFAEGTVRRNTLAVGPKCTICGRGTAAGDPDLQRGRGNVAVMGAAG